MPHTQWLPSYFKGNCAEALELWQIASDGFETYVQQLKSEDLDAPCIIPVSMVNPTHSRYIKYWPMSSTILLTTAVNWLPNFDNWVLKTLHPPI